MLFCSKINKIVKAPKFTSNTIGTTNLAYNFYNLLPFRK